MKFKMSFTKGRALSLIALMLTGSLALSGQTWYQVSMSPNDEALTLTNFDGYSCYSWLSPLLLVCLAALGTSAISAGATRLVSLWLGAGSAVAITLLSSIAISKQDLSGVAKELETATGIAATHGISGLDISTQPIASVSVLVFGVTAFLFVLAIFSIKDWKERASKPARQSKQPLKDSISLWDEQR